MTGYFLKKWYFDIQTSENEYIFFYCAFVHLLGYNICTFNMNSSQFGNEQIFSKSLSIPFLKDLTIESVPAVLDLGCGKIEFGHSAITMLIESTDIFCDLHYSIPTAYALAPLFIQLTEKKKILWQPLNLNSHVSGLVRLGGKEFGLSHAVGYIDYLFSNIFPLQTPVHILLWGRIHHDLIDITYTIAIGSPPERRWCKLFVQRENIISEIDDLIVRMEETRMSGHLQINYPVAYEIRGKKDDLNIHIQVKHLQEAVRSTFVDQKEMKNGFQYNLIRYLSKNPRGIKFFSMASIVVESLTKRQKIDDVIFIDEFVEFSS